MASLSRSVGFPSILGGAVGLFPRVNIVPISIPISERLEQLIREKLGEIASQLPAIDIGLWKAVPKKRPSYRRTRINYLSAGKKHVKHMDNIVRCPACGHVKRTHFMCMNCFMEIKQFLKGKRSLMKGEEKDQLPQIDEIDSKILYPGKYTTFDEYRLKQGQWIPQREKTLEHQKIQLKKRTKKTYLEED